MRNFVYRIYSIKTVYLRSDSLPLSVFMHHPQGLRFSRALPQMMASSYTKSRRFLHSMKSSRLFLMPVAEKPMSMSILFSSEDRWAPAPYLRIVSRKKASPVSLLSCLTGKNIIRVIFLPSFSGLYVNVTGDFTSSSFLADSMTLLMKSLVRRYLSSSWNSLLNESTE